MNDKKKKKPKGKKQSSEEKQSDQAATSYSQQENQENNKAKTETQSDANENEPWLCEDCNKSFIDDDSQVLECENCTKRYCRECVEIEPEEYEFLSKRADVHWFCSKCDSVVSETLENHQKIATEDKMVTEDKTVDTCENKVTDDKIGRIIKELEKMMMTITDRFESITEKVNNAVTESQVEEIVKRLLAKHEADKTPDSSENTKEIEIQTSLIMNRDVKQATKSNSDLSLKTCYSCLPCSSNVSEGQIANSFNSESYAEAAKLNLPCNVTDKGRKVDDKDQKAEETRVRQTQTKENTIYDQRAKNIIIHRVPESKETNIAAKKNDDTSFFHSLCSVIGVDVRSDVAYRIGPPKSGVNRPLKVTFKTVDDKTVFRKNLQKLRDAVEPFKGVSIMDDMTEEERAENKRLVKEAKEKTETDMNGHIYRVRGPPWNRYIVMIEKSS